MAVSYFIGESVEHGPERATQPYFITSVQEPIIPPAPVLPEIEPGTAWVDTIRGGAEFGVGADVPLDDTSFDRTLRATTLPSDWTQALIGSGAVTPTEDGLVLDTGLTPVSTAAIESDVSYIHLDFSVRVLAQAPASQVSMPVEVATLELDTGAVSARLSLVRGYANEGLQALGVIGDVYGAIVVPTSSVVLRVVRSGSFIAFFVGDVPVVAARDYTEATATVRLAARNEAYAGRVRSRWTDLAFSAHALIDEQLIEDKFIASGRIFGTVPATAIERRGLRDVRVFGVFGAVDLPLAFEYVLPVQKTLGQKPTERLVTFVDPQLRDGSS